MNAPVAVLVARLEHELETARLGLEQENAIGDSRATDAVLRASAIAKQLREAV